MKGAREILAQLQSERVDEDMTPNPIMMGLKEELQEKQTRIVGLQSMIEEKRQQRLELEKQAKALLEQERHLTQTDRDIELKTAHLTVMREKLDEARVIEELYSDKISNIHVFQPATFVERAASPDKKILAAGFLFLGLTTGLGLSFLRQGTSATLRTGEDVESQLGCLAVANIPRLGRMKSLRLRDQRLYRQKCQSLIAEVLLSQPRPQHSVRRSLGIISVDAGAGASTLAMHLAVTSNADCRMKTVLVDADSRQRSISKMFGLNGSPGLVELVSGSASHDECLQKVKDTPVELIASAADSCDQLLSGSGEEIVQALQAYLNDCDLMIVDLPAASQPDQAVALAQHLDSVLVVVESEKTEIASAERLLRRLSASDTQLIGVVMNKTRNYLPRVVRSFVSPRV